MAEKPSPDSYFLLASEFGHVGEMDEVLRVAMEGLEHFPTNPQLVGMRERALRALRQERIVSLRRELSESPRPAVWRELCGVLVESRQLQRAEETALAWLERSPEHLDAHLVLSEVRLERYFSDRGREQGRRFVKALNRVRDMSPGDLAELELRYTFASRIGAFGVALEAVQRILQITPGDAEWEARYREIEARAEDAPTIERALHRVEETGRFTDDGEVRTETSGPAPLIGDVRAKLRRLARLQNVNGSLYLRGETALVHGWKGAGAERMARGLRGVMRASQHTARRLGLGAIRRIDLEGEFGVFSVLPGSVDAGAVWCDGRPSSDVELTLGGLSGVANGDAEEAA